MTFVVADIGVNWDGDFTLAEEMMINAKEAGCNTVKFQAFNEKLIEGHPQKSRLMKSSISETNVEHINEISKKVGIEWFCTPMFVEIVNVLDPYVKRYKIRVVDGQSLIENKSTKLFEKILETGKQIIISSQSTPKKSRFYDNPKLSWLYSVSKYPCEFKDLDFSSIGDYNGYSNHCPHIIAPLTAVILGAQILEVHITSDKTKDFVDNPVSFDYQELKNLIKYVRECESILH